STVSSNVNTASTKDSTANLNDATIYAFLTNQQKGSQLDHADLEQIHDVDLEEIDLKWQLALLSMRARRFYQRTGKKITINGSDTAGFDKSKSDVAEEQVQTNMALMAFSDSKINDTEFKAATYKRGLATVEDQLATFRKNEVLFGEEITVLKREVGCKDYELGVLKAEYEKVKQEKEGIDFKIAKFDNASKDLDKLLASQITDKSLDEFKEPEFNGYGPRDTGLKSTIDCDKESDNSKENTDDSLEKEQVSDNESSSVESLLKVDKETVIGWKETVFHAAKKRESEKLEWSEVQSTRK
ncbi:hypothetical protein Tco_1545762, partial [Tanacetum coccineum]